MNTYTSSQETSQHEHPQHYVEIADPLTKPEACRDRSRQALMYGQVDTGFQFRRVSKEPGPNVYTKIFVLYSITQQDKPSRLDSSTWVLALFVSKEPGISVWAKIFVFDLTATRSQQGEGKVSAPTVLMTIQLDKQGWGLSSTTSNTMQNRKMLLSTTMRNEKMMTTAT